MGYPGYPVEIRTAAIRNSLQLPDDQLCAASGIAERHNYINEAQTCRRLWAIPATLLKFAQRRLEIACSSPMTRHATYHSGPHIVAPCHKRQPLSRHVVLGSRRNLGLIQLLFL
jgi:hypothetical protein